MKDSKKSKGILSQARKTFNTLVTVRLESIDRALGIRTMGFERAELIVFASLLLYTLVFSYYTILRQLSFTTSAWDLGIFDQAMWTTTHQGKLFYYTCELYYVPNGSFFGIHFSPILFLIVPVYALISRPETLLVIQSFVLALGAIPLYLLAKQKITRTAGVAFSLCYLLNPLLQGINCYDFHTEAFFPVLMLSSLYYLEKENWPKFFAFIFLSLMVMEQTSYIIIFLGIYMIWMYKNRMLGAIRRSKPELKTIVMAFSTIAIGVIWLFFAQWVIRSLNPSPPLELKALKNVAVLGANEPNSIPLYILQNPIKAFNALSFDFYQKFSYLVDIFAPLALFSFLSPAVLIPTIPWFGLSLVSNYPPYYSMGFQYSAFAIPFVFLSAVHGMRKIINGNDLNSRTAKRILTLMLTSSIIFCLAVSPISPLIQGDYPSPAYIQPKTTNNHTTVLNEIINLIPANESILTEDNIFPHVSERLDAYVVPPQVQGNTSGWQKAVQIVLSVNTTYILADLKLDPFVGRLLVTHANEEDYGLYASADRILLFKQYYSESPVLVQPMSIRYDHRDLINEGELLDDPSSVSKEVLCHNATSSSLDTFWYGPYDTLLQGTYNASFDLKVGSTVDKRLIVLDVFAQGQVLASMNLNASAFAKPNTWQNFTLQFALDQPVKNMEFRGLYASNATDLCLDYIDVAQTNSP